MGANIKFLRNRIKSVDSTLHLTKAMGLVASSKIRRAIDGMNKAKQYQSAFSEVMDILLSCPECKKSPYVQQRDGGKILMIVIAGDRGLAGGYNANVFRLMREYTDAEIIAIGKRAYDRYGIGYFSAEKFQPSDAFTLAKTICEKYNLGEYSKVGIVSTEYRSMIEQQVGIKWIFPLDIKSSNSNGVVFEPDENTILEMAIKEFVAGFIMAEVRGSFASEVAARRCAMDSAGKNAQEMIDELQLQYNRARQGTITQELTEIVAGSGL